MSDNNFPHKLLVLADIVEGLEELEENRVRNSNLGDLKLGTVEVQFTVDDKLLEGATFGLTMALDYIAHDIYWDAECNWAAANGAALRII